MPDRDALDAAEEAARVEVMESWDRADHLAAALKRYRAAVRKAAREMGEEGVIERVTPLSRSGRQEVIVTLRADRMPLALSDRVRVVRV